MTEFNQDQPWQTLKTQEVSDAKIFKLKEKTVLQPSSGKKHTVYEIDSPNWVNVVALTEGNQIILAKQFRHGIEEFCIEVPGGAVDIGESELESARRELEEETGFQSDQWKELGWIHPNPAILNNRCYFYLAQNCKRTKVQNLDESEEINVILKDLTEVFQWVENGVITHAMTIGALVKAFSLSKDNYGKS